MTLTAVWLFAVFLMATVATLRADQLTEGRPSGFIGAFGREKKEAPSEDAIRGALSMLDTDGDGYVSADEIFQLTEKYHIDVPKEKFDDFVRSADTNGDGKLSVDELVSILSGR